MGILSVPEVYYRKMTEILAGLEGVIYYVVRHFADSWMNRKAT